MMYYEFESGFDKYFKDTKLSSTEVILSELKSTKTKLSIYRFLYFATVTLFFISIVSALLVTIFNSKSSLVYACIAGICIFGLLIMPTTSMTEKAYLYCNTLISMLRESDSNSNRYEGYTPRFDFRVDNEPYFKETKKQDAPKEETIEVAQPKNRLKSR